MKRGITTLILLILLISPLILADNHEINIDPKEIAKGLAEATSKDNPWNETTVLSPVWQKAIGVFFGLNLQDDQKEISSTGAIVLFMVFIMFFVIILDILKLTPFLKKEILGEMTMQPVIALIATALISITGAFIGTKNLLMSGVAYTVAKINWQWLNDAIAHKTFGVILIGILIVLGLFLLNEILGWLHPVLKKYSEISRAEAKGRLMGTTIRNANEKD